MLFAQRYRLNPNAKQAAYLQNTFDACRFIYNEALAFKNNEWEQVKDLPKSERKTASKFDLMKRLVALKSRHPFLAEADSQALYAAVENLDTAFKNFYRRCKNGETPGYPKFKSRYRYPQSAKFPQGIKIDTKHIKIPKCQPIKQRGGRLFPEAQLRSITISVTATGKYYASVLYKDNRELPTSAPLPDRADQITAIDTNISQFGIMSTGEIIENPRYYRQRQRQLARAQRKLSKCERGSKRYDKQRLRVAVIHEKTANLRSNFLHHLTARIAKNHATAVEFHGIKKMMTDSRKPKRHHKNITRGFSDSALFEFRRQLQYKSEWNGTHLITVPTEKITNRVCMTCGHKNPEELAANDSYHCEQCGTLKQRGENSARRIQHLAFEQITQDQL